jgi:hypothetical protein
VAKERLGRGFCRLVALGRDLFARRSSHGVLERIAQPARCLRFTYDVLWSSPSRPGECLEVGGRRAAITGVLSPGERVPPGAPGLYYCATPASDFICGTLQLAAGMNLHVFTTGRGTPYGLAACPVLKVATRSELAERWHDLMDIDAGPIADGRAAVQEAS